MGGEGVLVFDFSAQAVDELVDGVVRNAGVVFGVGVDSLADLVFGDDLAGFFKKKI